MLWDFPNQSCQHCFYKSLVFDNLTRFFGICDLEKPILTFPPHSILSIQTFKIYLKIRNFLQKVTYDVTHANTETAGSKTSLEKKLNCVVKPPLASRPTEAVKFVEAVVVRLVALILLSRTEENLFEVVPRLFDEFFFRLFYRQKEQLALQPDTLTRCSAKGLLALPLLTRLVPLIVVELKSVINRDNYQERKNEIVKYFKTRT